MVPMPKLSLLELKKLIELFIGSGDEAVFGLQIGKNVLYDLRELLRVKVLYEFDHSDELSIKVPKASVFLCSVALVDKDVLVVLP